MNLFYHSIIRLARYKMQPSNYKVINIPKSLVQEIDLAYLNDDNQDHRLDIYYPRNTKGLLPAIIDIHGGAWIYGNKEVNKNFALELTKHGFGVVNVNYTLMPQATLKIQIQEIFAVLRFIYDYGSIYHLDCNQIILLGDSAGGHLAGLVYAIMNQEELQEIYQVDVVNVTIKALCLIHGVSDLSFLENSKNVVYRQTGIMIQGNSVRPAAWYKKACLLDVMANCPKLPVMLISSKKDLLHFQSVLTNQILNKYGWNVETLFWGNEQHLNHVFAILHPEYPESQKTIKKIADFINKECV